MRHPIGDPSVGSSRVGLAAVLLLTAATFSRPSPADARPRVGPGDRVFERTRTAPTAPIALFVQTTAAPATAYWLASVGGGVHTIAGDVLTAHVPTSQLPALRARPEVARIEENRRVHLRMDEARYWGYVDEAQAGADPLSQGYDGGGVLVGVVDGGMDWLHASFYSPKGGSRLVGLWDQATGEKAGPAPWGYGDACDKAMLDDTTCPHWATEMHGTHVTSIATGGSGAGAKYRGVAPGADIAFVNTGGPDGAEDDVVYGWTVGICDGAAWLFELAEKRGQPAVINMSLGAHEGPHDGTSLASQCLDNLSGPGRIIVAAAGNEGEGTTVEEISSDPLHVHATGGPAPTDAPSVSVLQASPEGAPTTIAVWLDKGAAPEITLAAEGDDDAGFSATWDGTGDVFGYVEVGGVQLGPVEIVSAGGGDGPTGAFIFIDDENQDGAEASVDWLLAVASDRRYDAFIDTTGGTGFWEGDPGTTVDHQMTIGFPAIARRVISVAAHVGSTGWTLDDGTELDPAADFGEAINPPGKRAGFSSRGPARDEAAAGHVPDLMAAGHYVIAALSSEAEDEDPEMIVTGEKAAGTAMVAEAGTSMASPVVAGAVALLLQANPTLTPEQVRDVLTKTAYADELPAVPNTQEGFGRLDVHAALAMVEAELPAGGGDGRGGGGGRAPIAGGGGGGNSGGGCSATSRGSGASPAAGLVLLCALLVMRLRRHGARRAGRSALAICGVAMMLGGCSGAKAKSKTATGPSAEKRATDEVRPADDTHPALTGELRRAVADAGDGDVELLLKLGSDAPADQTALRDALAAAGCDAKTVAGDIVTASCAAGRVDAWGAIAWVQRAEPARRAGRR